MSTPLHVDVDLARCEGHGQCEFAAPDVFAVTDDDSVEFVADPPESERAAVLKAAAVCPVRAITVTG